LNLDLEGRWWKLDLKVKLYGTLKDKMKAQALTSKDSEILKINSKENLRISDVLDELDISESEISHIFVNSRYSGIGKEVKEGDRIGIFPKNMAIMFAEIPKISAIYVTVKLFANLREYGPSKSVVDLPEGSTVKSLFKKFNVPKKEGKLISLINGQPCYENDCVLNDGDLVAIFPPIGGG
jgi:molybdopterin synthase sulfur carrier subunit